MCLSHVEALGVSNKDGLAWWYRTPDHRPGGYRTDARRAAFSRQLSCLSSQHSPERQCLLWRKINFPQCRLNHLAHLHTQDAGRALLAALSCPAGIYNVCDVTPIREP
jgi:hypothetical protein